MLINNLIKLIPPYPEEGLGGHPISKQHLKKGLVQDMGNGELESELTIRWVEVIFTRLSLLDEAELAGGNWHFVSFAAYLCGLSLLNSFADSHQRLLPINFWHTNNATAEVKENQRKVLKWLENNRVAHHRSHQAKPIRQVFVAWGILKWQDKILFHRREEPKERNDEKKAGNYGLIGGKANVDDLSRIASSDMSTHQLLMTLQQPDSPLIFKALDVTLHREVAEETGLSYELGHYQTKIWRDLQPFIDSQGTAPIYALTRYFFRLYQIELSELGYFALTEQLKQRPELIWCNETEIAQRKTVDGKTLYISALVRDFGDDPLELARQLLSLPDAFTDNYRFRDSSLSLSLSPEKIAFIKSHQTKEGLVDDSLSSEQRHLLVALGAHSRGILSTPAEFCELHPFGWIAVNDEYWLSELKQLARQLKHLDLPLIENLEDRYFRLSLSSEKIFFDADLFGYRLKSEAKKSKLVLIRLAIETPLGSVFECKEIIDLPNNLAQDLRQLESKNISQHDNPDLARRVRSALQKYYSAMGLLRLLVIQNKMYGLTISPFGK